MTLSPESEFTPVTTPNLASAGEKPEVAFTEEVMISATPTPLFQPPTAPEPDNPQHRLIWISIVVIALIILATFGAWVWFEYQRLAEFQAEMLETETLELTDENKASELPVEALISASVVPTASPEATQSATTLPPDWVTQEYTSNGQLVWSLSQPPNTTANKAGLQEGYLGLESGWNQGQYLTEFSFPLFSGGIPSTFDQWVTDYLTSDPNLSGDVSVQKQVKDGVLLRVVKNGTTLKSGVSLPTTLVFIWSHTDDQNVEHNPAMISIKQTAGSQRQVEAFADLIIQGVSF